MRAGRADLRRVRPGAGVIWPFSNFPLHISGWRMVASPPSRNLRRARLRRSSIFGRNVASVRASSGPDIMRHKPPRALAYARRHRSRFVAELKQFVRFPSVSNQPQRAGDLRKCASWLAAPLRRIGLEQVRIVPTDRHPVVYAAWHHARGRPTLLLYGHYDVQPAEPVEQWRTPPFDPVVKHNNLYGRGASDDKGQLFTHVKALESYLKTERALPVNVKCIFEGEEELGGTPGLESFVQRNQTALRADAALVSDTRMLGPERPALG